MLDYPDTQTEKPAAGHEAARDIRAFLKAHPELAQRYKNARRVQRIAKHDRTVEITNRCNLFCEGCYFFEGDGSALQREEDETSKWEELFKQFAAEGVKHVNLAGAEPTLHIERIELAHKYVPYGLIYTNGTIKLPKHIPYAIHVSVWGDADVTATLRGGNHLERSIRHYSGDPRATFIYTVSRQNIDTIRPIVERFHEENIRVSFNFFSPTETYNKKLDEKRGNDNRFFRISTEENNMRLQSEDFPRVREIIEELKAEYPETVVMPRLYLNKATQEGPLYTLNEDGVALNCGGSNASPWFQLYGTDAQKNPNKCCTPNVDCSTCRLYPSAKATLMFDFESALQSRDAFEDWLDLVECWNKLMMFDHDGAETVAAE